MSNDANGQDDRTGSDQRSELARTLIRHSLALIWALIGGLVILAFAQAINVNIGANYQTALDKVMSGVLPLLGAWIGAIIAFYFGRENYDAAVRNVRQIIREKTPDQLESIFVKDVMVPASKLVTATTPAENDLPLHGGILRRLEERGLGRLIVISGEMAATDFTPGSGAIAKGVLHDSVINRFIVDQVARHQRTADAITLGDLLADPEIARLLSSAVVYVTPEATLADVRRKMDEASRNASATVRDALVTASGKAGEPLQGYLTDIDLADKGALK